MTPTSSTTDSVSAAVLEAAEAVPLDDSVIPEKPKSTKGQFLWTVGFAFAMVAVQLGQGILLVRLLGPEGRGEYATAVLYVQMLLYVGLMGGLEVICRYAAAEETKSHSESQNRLRRSALWLGITTGIVTTTIVIVLNLVALPESKQGLWPIAMICSLSLIGQHVMLIMTAVDRGSGEFSKYNTRRFIAAAAFPLLLLIAALVTDVGVMTAGILMVVASLISMGTCIIGVPHPIRGQRELRTKKLLLESRPYGLSMLVTDLFERLDLLLVMWLAPFIEQGFYASMVPAVYPLTVIPNTLGLFLFNAGANTDRQLKTSDVHRILGTSIAIQAVTTIMFMLVIGPLVLILYGQDFQPAIIFALWLAPVSAIKGVLQGLDSYLKGRGRPLAPIKARGFAMLVMMATTWLLFPSMGTLSIAAAALSGQVVCLIWLSAIVYADVYQQSQNSQVEGV
ncbi:lipopolysaccharide biosynthesis protein [Rubripirellula amarantea]|nr:lipopolysaccharide biosynthesis protein [Rubripirellula amarantea]